MAPKDICSYPLTGCSDDIDLTVTQHHFSLHYMTMMVFDAPQTPAIKGDLRQSVHALVRRSVPGRPLLDPPDVMYIVFLLFTLVIVIAVLWKAYRRQQEQREVK